MTSRYDAVVIGAGLGGLTAAAILARAGKSVVVVERSNSVGGAASSYKSGDLFVEGSLHVTGDPHHPDDPKHAPLTRAGVLDSVRWVPARALHALKGKAFGGDLVIPDDRTAAKAAMVARFPDAREALKSYFAKLDDRTDENRSFAEILAGLFPDRHDIQCCLAADIACLHDDAATLDWMHVARTQWALLNGARYVEGGSQRLSSALARAVRNAGGDVLVRRAVTAIGFDAQGRANSITHEAKAGGDPKIVSAGCVIGNAAPRALAELCPAPARETLFAHDAQLAPSISLFAMTLGLSQAPATFGVDSFVTQLWPDWIGSLSDFAAATTLMSAEPGDKMPPLAIADYAAIPSGVPSPPFVLSVFGPDNLANWDASDMDAYRAKRGRWQDAIVAFLDATYPGLGGAIVTSSFNTALSVRQYLNAPTGAVYGYAPTLSNARTRTPSPLTPVDGLYLSSAHAGSGGYSGAIAAGAACADVVLDASN